MSTKKGSKKSKLTKREKPKVNPELEGFDISIDSFGEIRTNYNIDAINKFLNRHVDDKKLRDRDDIDRDDEQEKPDDKED
jgi:hypothetical protein